MAAYGDSKTVLQMVKLKLDLSVDILQGDGFSPYLLVIVLDYAMRTTTE